MRATSRDPGASNARQGADETDEGLTEDELYHVLQSQRRRNALRYLQAHDGPVRMRELAEQVAAWEHDTTLHALTSQERQRVYIPLYQSHLPKLDDAGVIDYNQSRGVVERTSLADQLDPYLDGSIAEIDGDAAADDRRWNGYFAGAIGVGALAVGGASLGLPGLSAMSGVALGMLLFVVFAGLTLARIVDTRRSA